MKNNTRIEELRKKYNIVFDLVIKLEKRWYDYTEINVNMNYDEFKSYHNKLIRRLDRIKGEIERYEIF